MRNFLMIGVGLLLGIAGMLVADRWDTPPNSDLTQSGSERKLTNPLRSERTNSSTSDRISKKTVPFSRSTQNADRLRAEMTNYAYVSSDKRNVVDGLTEEEAASLSLSLRAFNDKIRNHERRTLKIEEQGSEKAVIFIPPLAEDGHLHKEFESSLVESLGKERAEARFFLLEHKLQQQFSHWGEASQRITIEFGESEYLINHDVIIDDGTYHYKWLWKTKVDSTFPWLHEVLGHSPPIAEQESTPIGNPKSK